MHFSVSLACLALLHQAVGVPVPVLAPTGGIPPAAPPAANMNGPGLISDVSQAFYFPREQEHNKRVG